MKAKQKVQVCMHTYANIHSLPITCEAHAHCKYVLPQAPLFAYSAQLQLECLCLRPCTFPVLSLTSPSAAII